METGSRHAPVLLKETIDLLNIKPGGTYIDGTLGLGGHAEAVLRRLNQGGRLLGLEVDPDNMKLAENRLQPFGDQLIIRLVNFRRLEEILTEIGWSEVDGMLFDLGVSSTQLDEGRRGFSFKEDSPLDMRLDPQGPLTAMQLLQRMDEEQFARTLEEFGEVRGAKGLARGILNEVAEGRIKSTRQLTSYVERRLSRRGLAHPATRVFLALRCLVNDELGAVREMLDRAPMKLAVGGRLAVITFHSLEDRPVKERFKQMALEGKDGKKFVAVTRKPVVPTQEEQDINPRSRSAKLRVLERII